MDAHIGVSSDLKNIFLGIDPNIDIVEWNISDHNWVLDRKMCVPEIINRDTWQYLDSDKIKKFQDKYDNFLKGFDGFITGHVLAFSMIYEKYNKPIYSSNTCRYDLPFCQTKDLKMLKIYNKVKIKKYCK
jgi:hypothetical protein